MGCETAPRRGLCSGCLLVLVKDSQLATEMGLQSAQQLVIELESRSVMQMDEQLAS